MFISNEVGLLFTLSSYQGNQEFDKHFNLKRLSTVAFGVQINYSLIAALSVTVHAEVGKRFTTMPFIFWRVHFIWVKYYSCFVDMSVIAKSFLFTCVLYVDKS